MCCVRLRCRLKSAGVSLYKLRQRLCRALEIEPAGQQERALTALTARIAELERMPVRELREMALHTGVEEAALVGALEGAVDRKSAVLDLLLPNRLPWKWWTWVTQVSIIYWLSLFRLEAQQFINGHKFGCAEIHVSIVSYWSQKDESLLFDVDPREKNPTRKSKCQGG